VNSGNVVAKYLRISDDDGRYGDSQSISGQRDLIDGFLRAHPELKNARVMEFSDDGYSGTNFDRPEVTELLKLVRSGKVHCIVVKDFSRLGRNYIEVGDYIEQIFPFLRVRFISINDGYDSAVQGCSAGDVSVAFKHLCNDYYCKDLSQKVKSGLKTARETGKYLSGYEVYGYKKSAEDKYRLLLDETSAPVVRRIFDMALSGEKPPQIAAKLNLDGIPTPMEYLSEKRGIRTWSDLKKIWTGTEITRLIRDIRYTGAVTHGMYTVDYLGSRRSHKTPMSEWVVTDGQHEPIVSKEEFEKAGLCIRKIKTSVSKTNPRVPSPYSLPVTVRCGSCGHAMVKNGAKVMAYYCRYRNMPSCDSCFTGKIEVEALKSILLASIQPLWDAVMEQKKAASVKTASSSVDTLKQIGVLQKESDRLKKGKLTLYNRYGDGEISREEYINQRKSADERIQELLAEIQSLEQLSVRNDTSTNPTHPAFDALQNISGPLRYSNELIEALVEHVVVYDESRVEIKWKFPDMLAALKIQ